MLDLWVEKYKPATLDEYVFRDPAMRQQIEGWLEAGSLPHLLFSGTQGTGKSALAGLLLKLLDIPSGDILKLNGSKERQIDAFQDKIGNFVNTWALGDSGIKYILIEEADRLSPLSQDLLREEINTYSDVTRWLMSANIRGRIIPPLHSRLQEIKFQSLDKTDYTVKAGQILTDENVDFEIDDLMHYVNASYPDLRKCINLLQQHSVNGKLHLPVENVEADKDYLISMVDLFKRGKFTEARKLIVSQVQPDEYNDIYKFFYQNLDLFGDTEDQQDEALLIIRKAVVNMAWVADQEILMSATLVELGRIRK